MQQAAGRIQPFETVKNAVDLLNEVGIDRINIDLMYGLPKQTVDDVRRTVTLAHSLKPQRVAVFGYAHVPWFRPQQRLIEQSDLPTSPERLAQSEAAHDTLVEFGYQAIGLDHYARPDDELFAQSGKLQRNFQGYTDDDADALIGLGASAIGRLPQGFAQNAPAVGNYSRAIAEGKLATVKGIALIRRRPPARQHHRAADVRHGGGSGRHRARVRVVSAADFSEELEQLRPYRENGSVEIDGHRIRITEQGRPYMRLVASAFDTYLPGAKSRHSVAV